MTTFDVPLPEGIPTESLIESVTTTTTTATTNGDSKERIYNGLNDKLIPIYCSILAAVVVGVVAFIIFKRWGQEPGVATAQSEENDASRVLAKCQKQKEAKIYTFLQIHMDDKMRLDFMFPQFHI